MKTNSTVLNFYNSSKIKAKNQSSPRRMTFPVNSLLVSEISKPTEQIEFKLNNNESKNLTFVIHRAYITQRSNERQGSANTLTRAEVRGGGRKPWRQKGTGRARAGSSRSPLWRGGGVSFGPKPKVYLKKINRKEWRVALRSLLIQKSQNIIILDNLEKAYENNKTGTFKSSFTRFGINFNQRVLLIVESKNSPLLKVTQNIKTIKVLTANRLNIKEIIYAKKILITKDSLKLIEETYNE